MRRGERRERPAATGARGRTASRPVSTPSPVVARSRKMTWPDCSPPSTRSCSSIAASTLRSPTGVSTMPMPRARERAPQPEVRHHGHRDRVVAQRARARAGRARASAMIWSPSTSAPRSSTASTRSASPSSARPSVGAVRRAPRPATPRDASNRTPSLMLRPSGSACSTTTSAPSARATRAARRSNAAPFAQSTTTRSPSSVRPSSAPTRCATYSSTAIARRRHADVGHVARGAVAERRPRARASIAASTSSGELAAAGARCSFTPLSVHGLWLAEIDRGRGAVAAARGTRSPASAARRAARRRRPRAASPRSERGLDARARLARVAADDERARAPSTRAAARPSATTNVVGEVGVRVAADAVGAEPQHAARRRLPLRVLRRLAGLLEAVLAPLLLARVAREQPGLLQHGRACRGRARSSARAMPRRIAPACPLTPPPSSVASTS